MYHTYSQTMKRNQAEKHIRNEIPTCFRKKTFWTVILDYALTTASVAGLLIALLFVIML